VPKFVRELILNDDYNAVDFCVVKFGDTNLDSTPRTKWQEAMKDGKNHSQDMWQGWSGDQLASIRGCVDD
jgi:hypothetical protein